MMAEKHPSARATFLIALPDELIQQILSYLSALDVVSISSTCQTLYQQAQDDKLWEGLVNENLPKRIDHPGPFDSFRNLYSAHHPYWFLPKNKIWFSDGEYTGRLIIARYDNRRGVIEAFRLLAELKEETFTQWSSNPEVIIQSFNPQLRLWMDDPVIELRNPQGLLPRNRQYCPDQFKMTMSSYGQGVYSSFALCRGNVGRDPSLPSDLVWPPITIPAERSLRKNQERLTDENSNTFLQAQRESPDPRALSETSFYLRKWLHFGLGQPIVPHDQGFHLSMFATLDPEIYTPTKEKPYQGIWVGDYNFHGCEFLLFLQRDPGSATPLSNSARRETRLISNGLHNLYNNQNNGGGAHGVDEWERASLPETQITTQADGSEDTGVSGRLEGIKLTGDPNIPRGEISFVAEDIGPSGTVYFSHDEEFGGARVVRSKGHIAFQQFTDDQWVNTELILISPDCVAQYWKPMRHVSYFRRVDVDQFARV
ncbi:uncharacterized protein TRUGW13939_00847 [Talaromyces rugulosus]|uniref:F-box domain-containing protein n=1 Tax=Talaromyces rugulosus TaxID=121627 RepID=A0A7H8QID9_TALRU|nr:uncharacterized protein TRUGW13939_00847 [Talaromyces rugulosus]QKX53767.1 hypothetical protein TRUGW13939_00847 [Talaromyces rugulosus]